MLVESAEDILNEFNWVYNADDNSSPLDNLEEPAKGIAILIRDKESLLLDDIVAATGKEVSGVLGILTLLELKSIIRRLPNGRYISLV